MVDDSGELEGIAAGLFDEAGQDPCDPPNVMRMIRSLLGADGFRRGSNLVVGRACLAQTPGGPRIYATRAATLHDVLHELAHWALRRAGYVGEREEQNANYIAGALLMPRRAMATASRDRLTLPELAERFRTSETCAALREAEVQRLPRVIVAPKHIHVRGPEEWIWPAETTLRSWAKRGKPGLRKTQLTDDPGRVVLDAENT